MSSEKIQDFFANLIVRWRKSKEFRVLVGSIIILLAIGIAFLPLQAPKNFPINSLVTIKSGEGLHEISADLKSGGFIRSQFYFEKLVIIYGLQRKIIAGDYYFDSPVSLQGIIKRITSGSYGLTASKVTIPEGFNIYQIANLLTSKFDTFERNTFLTLAENKEGYLFPDTYFFLPNVKPIDVIKTLSDNFNTKIATVTPDLVASKHSLNEIITMASILEEEAPTDKDRKIISGILWHRIALGMPLQVDATFQYVNGKGTHELSTEDLEIDSPYNTYKYKGLPPGPISNPGMESIEAALHPTTTKYLYYLSDHKGTIYYSETFEEHTAKRQKYLTGPK